jgi:hypothetical protein
MKSCPLEKPVILTRDGINLKDKKNESLMIQNIPLIAGEANHKFLCPSNRKRWLLL